jgi:hypothetical protein
MLLVSSDRNVYELDPRTRALRVGVQAAIRLEGVAPTPSGGLYVVEGQSRIVHIAADGSRAVLADGLNGVHGILSTVDGLVACESYAGNVRLVTEKALARSRAASAIPPTLRRLPMGACT